MTREDKVRRGQDAALLLDSGVFRNALNEVENELAEAWKQTRPEAVADRERMYLMVQLMADIGRVLTKWKGEATFEIHETERAKRPQVN